jgi:hypothetical protein
LFVPCVLAITKDSVLGRAMTHLITNSEVDLHVVESEAETLVELINEIVYYEADVILLEKSSPFAGKEALTKMLSLYAKLLVIVISDDSNWLHIYRREDILLTSSTDLISVIQSV